MFVMIEAARDGGFIVKTDKSLVATFAGTMDACFAYARREFITKGHFPYYNPPAEKPDAEADAAKSQEAKDALRGKLGDLDLPTRVRNVMRDEGLVYVDEVRRMTDWQLLRLPNFGRVSLKQLREATKERE